MAEFLILPKAFVEYVSTFKRLPIPPEAQLESLRSEIEIVCLDTAMGVVETDGLLGQCDPGDPASGPC